jgi:hypothetical protein
MIRLPQRSVTRFFIPMIDVLTLLFCIFLMMPAVKPSGEAAAGEFTPADKLAEREAALAKREAELEAERRRLQKELDRLRREAAKDVKEKLFTRVLEIDAKTGKLYYRDPDRVELRDEAAARALIRRDRDRLSPGREPYYLILYPRDSSSDKPTEEQRQQYDQWFVEEGHGFDAPYAAKGKP